jgi:hypothetical protein
MVRPINRKALVKESATIRCIYFGMGDNWGGGGVLNPSVDWY